MPSHAWNEENMADALFDIIDNHLSLRKSAKKHGIAPQTLSDRLHAGSSVQEAKKPQQRLSTTEEKKILR
ncbi:hypothetical protein M406DRAFT_260166 [Cryphonectria parasitica EP155]|uniref:HTH psq-type domain-containing protein n=1 Tax=Cryphonectria parasitica (strain ATCC 38755 / EP155) TaxID=660469 RepID=A0A9P4Y162_CRYP1|nr:uncharacterized protein M406DRAFT_260166 [Cryphonectria parasitica EP155]KAF3765097.1 hypothetical protein M406DRAFT_260166 [Cryphonectria parasitica EP155]